MFILVLSFFFYYFSKNSQFMQIFQFKKYAYYSKVSNTLRSLII